jgi:RNA 3'-terminal phosphate cyclase (ATP)
MSTTTPIVIDGSFGEGGGQILRSALALSGITGQPFVLENIRAGRKKPGLMRQHLTCVQAAAALCGAELHGAALSSTTLRFWPGPPAILRRGGRFKFSIGTAGSTSLVVQTVLPMLACGAGEDGDVGDAVVDVDGGTHVPFAPVTDFLQRVFLPALAPLGVSAQLQRERVGFYPAGGGQVVLRVGRTHRVARKASRPLSLLQRGTLTSLRAVSLATDASAAFAAQCTTAIARSLRAAVADDVGADIAVAVENDVVRAPGKGMAVWLEVACQGATELFSAIPERGDDAKDVAARTVAEAAAWLNADVAVGEHLADQLLLPLALLGGGAFSTTAPTLHSKTNAEVIARFLPDVRVSFEEERQGAWHARVVAPADLPLP